MAASIGPSISFSEQKELLKTVATWIRPYVVTTGIANGLYVIATSLETGDLDAAQNLRSILDAHFRTIKANSEQVSSLKNTPLVITSNANGQNPSIADERMEATTLYKATKKALMLAESVIKQYIQEKTAAGVADGDMKV